jgi:hypothetical protein
MIKDKLLKYYAKGNDTILVGIFLFSLYQNKTWEFVFSSVFIAEWLRRTTGQELSTKHFHSRLVFGSCIVHQLKAMKVEVKRAESDQTGRVNNMYVNSTSWLKVYPFRNIIRG